MIKGAKPSEMPGFIPPQLATLKLKAPMGDKWIHEIKFDGYRVQVHLNKGKAKIYTRNGHDWTNRFHLIAESFNIPVERAIFDGEVVVIKDGRTNFSGCTRQRPTEKHAPLRFRDAASLMASADATGRTTRAVNANPFLKEFTVRDLKNWANRKMHSYYAAYSGIVFGPGNETLCLSEIQSDWQVMSNRAMLCLETLHESGFGR